MTMLPAAVAMGLTAVATAAALQRAPRAIGLRLPDATLGEPFTSIYSVRELADGRVLISDYSQDNRVVVADMVSGRVRRVGNVGAGPREYRQAGRLFALPGDSTLLIDSPQRGRWWLLMHNDSIVRNVPPDLPALRAVGGSPSGVDDRGRVLGVRSAGSERLAHNRIRLQLMAVIGDRNSSQADTIASLRGDEYQITQVGTRERPFWIQTGLSGSVAEQALLFPDGWIAVVRIEPYRVEWLTSSGTWIRGPEVPWEWPRADAGEKAAALERLRRRYGDRAKQDDSRWADRLAPIPTNALIAAPDGNLFVLRAQWSQAEDTRYDVFDHNGKRIAQVALPDSERVVGFGRRSVYVSVKDGDGFHRLRRHPWP
jgi:hypothetical protein